MNKNLVKSVIDKTDTDELDKKFYDVMMQIKKDKYRLEFLEVKNNVNELINNMSHQRALRFINREINDLKHNNDKDKKQFIDDSIKFLEKKKNDVEKLVEKQKIENNTLKNLFDVNKHLKQELKEIKKHLKQELKEIRKQKNDIKQKLNEEIQKNKYKNKDLKNQLKEQKKELMKKIKEHAITKKSKEIREIYKKRKVDKLVKEREHLYDNLEFETIQIDTAYKDFSSTWFIRKNLNVKKSKSYNFNIKVNCNADALNIIIKMNEPRFNLYTQYLEKYKNIRINERIRCVFRYKLIGDVYAYATVDLPKENYDHQCNATFHHKDEIADALNKNNEIMLNAIQDYD